MRKKVTQFAAIMEKVLKDNDYKGGWEDADINYLYRRMLAKAGELAGELRSPHPSSAEVAKEAADVANFAMMIVYVCGALDLEAPLEPGT